MVVKRLENTLLMFLSTFCNDTSSPSLEAWSRNPCSPRISVTQEEGKIKKIKKKKTKEKRKKPLHQPLPVRKAALIRWKRLLSLFFLQCSLKKSIPHSHLPLLPFTVSANRETPSITLPWGLTMTLRKSQFIYLGGSANLPRGSRIRGFILHKQQSPTPTASQFKHRNPEAGK